MPQLLSLRLPINYTESLLYQAASIQLKVSKRKINAIQLIRHSIDARSKNIMADVQIHVFIEEPFEDYFSFTPKLQNVTNNKEVIIVGCGPAGLFAALRLIERGYKPIIIERGKDVRSRRRDLAMMNKEGIVNPESNYCFGEGGAGTYSDGKLYTRSTKRGDVLRSLQWFCHFGADKNILTNAHPHIGTNKLPQIITAMRNAIIDCGGLVLFESKLTDILIENECIKGLVVNNAEKLFADNVILATGHSARDIYTLLDNKKIRIESKSFALGVRIEHPQSLIDSMQYHCDINKGRNTILPPASYSLVSQESGKGVFSFCMCPGGIIAPAATQEGALVVNGWSPSKRNNPYANSGMVVTVDEKDFAQYGFKGNLAGMHYQQMVEANAWVAGGGALVAPSQRMADFSNNKLSSSLPQCSYLPGVNSILLSDVLPKAVYQSLANGFRTFGNKKKGYFTNEAIVVATESRTSSPVRIPRDVINLQHPQIKGLYPCAEGAGYAGGIISAAMDGERVADCIL